MNANDLRTASDWIGTDRVYDLGEFIDPDGSLYVLYMLNIQAGDTDGLRFSCGAHFGDRPEDYVSGEFTGSRTMGCDIIHEAVRRALLILTGTVAPRLRVVS